MKIVYGLVCLLTAVCLAAGSSSSAEEIEATERIVPEVKAYRINPHPPILDGLLDDPIWKSSGLDLMNTFTQNEPDEGDAPTEQTQVAIAYDDEALYLAYWCYDSEPDQISRQLVRRDRGSESDFISFYIDPFHDHQTGYIFSVSAAGVQRDWRLYNDDHWDRSWDGIWSSAVHKQPWGWSAEIKIPYHCLRFSEKDSHVWGVNFRRYINRKGESLVWSYIPSSVSGDASKMGHLSNLTEIRPARHMEILPYVVSSLEYEPESQGNPDGKRLGGNAGVDIKVGLSSNLILDATFNPDFGQVELDSPVLNLSTFESWFPERRPFFLEGSDLFSTRMDLFYSRRIGRSPWQSVDDEDLDYYTEYPKATTILGAAKLTGKLSSGTSVAFLSAVTDEESADYITTTGETGEGVVEPRAGYSVLRVKQDVHGNSSVGGMMTMAVQEQALPAVTGGLDWRAVTTNNNWAFSGQGVFSRVDAENTGFGGTINVSKNGGEHIRGSMGGTIKDENLNLNRLGFMGRNGTRSGWAWGQWRTNDDWWIVRNSWNNVNINASWNWDNNNLSKSWNFNNCIEFTNNWMGGFGFAQNFGDYDDRATRGHGLWERPASWNTWLWLDSNSRKRFSWEVDFGYGNSLTSPWWSSELLLRYRPATNASFILYGSFTHDFGQLSWVDNPDDDTTIFADRDQDIFKVESSFSYVPRPNLSVQLSAEGLLTGLDYKNYRPFLGNDQYGGPVAGYDNDHLFSALNSTLLLRWEYGPGSTMYLVWTRACAKDDDTVNKLDWSKDLDRFFSGEAENVFMAKVSYWFNM
ncbi:MAG: hypothetical protein GY835_15205 [bacterium]|nr:hypothetical protein [bacterium]